VGGVPAAHPDRAIASMEALVRQSSACFMTRAISRGSFFHSLSASSYRDAKRLTAPCRELSSPRPIASLAVMPSNLNSSSAIGTSLLYASSSRDANTASWPSSLGMLTCTASLYLWRMSLFTDCGSCNACHVSHSTSCCSTNISLNTSAALSRRCFSRSRSRSCLCLFRSCSRSCLRFLLSFQRATPPAIRPTMSATEAVMTAGVIASVA
jgi:hypothetical protein